MGTGVSSLLSSPNLFSSLTLYFVVVFFISIVTYIKYASQSIQSRLEILCF
ncbi:hypothetical protein FM106_31955 [Brachybacterium faecium]|nr:hypothetical protein FM106_31955 [Brachybacterium faecium]